MKFEKKRRGGVVGSVGSGFYGKAQGKKHPHESLFLQSSHEERVNDMRHLGSLLVISFLVLVFGGCNMYGPNGDLAKEGASGISYGRVKCPACGFEFATPEAKAVQDLSEEGASGITYGRVKCAKCGFAFDAPVQKPVEDLSKEGVSGISYGRVKCPKCGFEFDAPDHEEGVGK
jgi:rubredoxin